MIKKLSVLCIALCVSTAAYAQANLIKGVLEASSKASAQAGKQLARSAALSAQAERAAAATTKWAAERAVSRTMLKYEALKAKNLANLDRALTRATLPPTLGRLVVTELPLGIAPNAVGLQRVKMPKVVTPVNYSYVQYVRKIGLDQVKSIPHRWVGPKGEHVLYDSQSQLARDLDAFYKGDTDIYVSSDGRKVKLYALPVDGILYKPAEHEVPFVLNSNEYFVVYDIETQTGKIAQNIPQVYGYSKYKRVAPTAEHQKLEDLYRRAKKEREIYGWITKDLDTEIGKVIEVYSGESVCHALSDKSSYFLGAARTKYRTIPNDDSAYQLEKRVNARDRATGYWKEIWDEFIPYSFDSVNELGRALHAHIQEGFGAEVKNEVTGEFYRVYELPVKGIKIRQLDDSFVELDGYKEVVLYEEKDNTSWLVDRKTLENSEDYTFYNRYWDYDFYWFELTEYSSPRVCKHFFCKRPDSKYFQLYS